MTRFDGALRYYVLDKSDGSVAPTDMMTWARQYEDIEKRRVGSDLVDGLRVSTVFLGVDHDFSGGPPVLFETTVFDEDPGGRPGADLRCWRYQTYVAAVAGHEEVVMAIRFLGADALFDLEVPAA
jgi:hypothetical protein